MEQGNQNVVPMTSGKAIGSLVCGIMGLTCLLPFVGPIIAVILGHISHSQIKKSNGELTGEGLALGGMITGYIGLASFLLITPIMAGMLLPVLSKAREKARRVNCAGNLKQIGLGNLMYSGDYKGAFPLDLAALNSAGYLPDGRVYACPSCSAHNAETATASDSCYEYFGSGIKDENAQASIVVIAADRGENHPGREWVNALFADGHVEGGKGKDIHQVAAQKGWIVPNAKQ